MNKKLKFTISLLAIMIILLWALLAFLIKEDLIPRFSLWANLIVGTTTIIISFLALYISILTYKKNIEEKKQKREEEAVRFIHDNNDEI